MNSKNVRRYFSEEGFGSLEWIRDNVTAAAEMAEEDCEELIRPLYRANRMDVNELGEVLDKLTDAAMIQHLFAENVTVFHSLAAGWSSGSHVFNEHEMNLELAQKASREKMELIFGHPIVCKYLVCTWYGDNYGNTILGSMSETDFHGRSIGPLLGSRWFYHSWKRLVHKKLLDERHAHSIKAEKRKVRAAFEKGDRVRAKKVMLEYMLACPMTEVVAKKIMKG